EQGWMEIGTMGRSVEASLAPGVALGSVRVEAPGGRRRMKRRHWQLVAGLALVAVSLILYAIHYVVFGDSRHIFLWSFTSLAFLPISVLFVTLIINRLLTDRDRRAKLQKMNMVIGAFFSEVGNDLLALLSRWDDDVEPIRPVLAIRSDWQDRDFKLAARRLAGHKYSIVEGLVNLQEAQEFLTSKRASLLRLLENPNLLEHEAFTALLRAVLHVAEELDYRDRLEGLPESDRKHLAGDFRRAYALLVRQWLEYLRFIKTAYPYLFSLAIRTNPFDTEATPIIGE
ncbi:MAG: hypothetical protein WBC63_00030, partial [Candidatus Bipolaricaulia bacterium]